MFSCQLLYHLVTHYVDVALAEGTPGLHLDAQRVVVGDVLHLAHQMTDQRALSAAGGAENGKIFDHGISF